MPGMPASPGKPFKWLLAVVHGNFVFITGQCRSTSMRLSDCGRDRWSFGISRRLLPKPDTSWPSISHPRTSRRITEGLRETGDLPQDLADVWDLEKVMCGFAMSFLPAATSRPCASAHAAGSKSLRSAASLAPMKRSRASATRKSRPALAVSLAVEYAALCSPHRWPDISSRLDIAFRWLIRSIGCSKRCRSARCAKAGSSALFASIQIAERST